jgi:hypothetical protein
MTFKQYVNINHELLNIIPHTAVNVLELGCATGLLGAAFKQTHAAQWTGVDYNPRALSDAAKIIDHIALVDLNNPKKEHLPGTNYDTVVMGDVLEHLSNPLVAMKFVHEVSSPDAQAFCCMPIMTNIGIIERMLLGDLSYDEYGLLDTTHVRFMSIASTIKLFLDSGWLPTIVGTRFVGIGDGADKAAFTNALIEAATHLNIPRSTSERNLFSYQIWIQSYKSPIFPVKKNKFSVIVPVNNATIFNVNLKRSPGLAEVDAEIIPIYGAKNAAEALAEGIKQVTNKWVLFCHQDLYIPSGSGYALSSLFDMPDEEARNTLIGFVGMSDKQQHGMIIDRVHRFDHPRTDLTTSLDEVAVALTTDSVHTIDPDFGWHLWATDMCVRSTEFSRVRVERVPLFHNSVTENGPTESFNASVDLLFQKHPQLTEITACTGVLVPKP